MDPAPASREPTADAPAEAAPAGPEEPVKAPGCGGCCLAIAGERPEDLGEFLGIIQATRKPPRDCAHKAMLTLFKIHGRADGVVDRFQRQLQIYL